MAQEAKITLLNEKLQHFVAMYRAWPSRVVLSLGFDAATQIVGRAEVDVVVGVA
jgi:hypothetical protein